MTLMLQTPTAAVKTIAAELLTAGSQQQLHTNKHGLAQLPQSSKHNRLLKLRATVRTSETHTKQQQWT